MLKKDYKIIIPIHLYNEFVISKEIIKSLLLPFNVEN